MAAFRFSPSKYKAKPTNGFSSKLEQAVFNRLVSLELAGEIECIKKQPKTQLSDAAITYRADFSFIEKKTGDTVWVEAKGMELGTWKLKKKLWSFYGPGRLQIYKGDYRRPTLAEELVPNPKESICPGCGARLRK